MKNKLYLLVLTFAVATSSAFAAGPLEMACGAAPCPPPTDYASQVKNLYDLGSAPVSLNPGVYAGRCYGAPLPPQNPAEPQAQAALLRVMNIAENADQGPLFPVDNQIGFAVFVTSMEPVDYFDDGKDLEDGPVPSSQILAACSQDNALVAASSEMPNQEAYALRKNGDYLVVKAEMTADLPSFGLKAGDAFGYCYFFKKVE